MMNVPNDFSFLSENQWRDRENTLLGHIDRCRGQDLNDLRQPDLSDQEIIELARHLTGLHNLEAKIVSKRARRWHHDRMP